MLGAGPAWSMRVFDRHVVKHGSENLGEGDGENFR